jgi:hypothetical protein
VGLRKDIAVLDEQIAVLDDEVESLRMRAVISETPLSVREHAEASRHAELAHRARESAQHQLASLETQRDELLQEISLEVGT